MLKSRFPIKYEIMSTFLHEVLLISFPNLPKHPSSILANPLLIFSHYRIKSSYVNDNKLLYIPFLGSLSLVFPSRTALSVIFSTGFPLPLLFPRFAPFPFALRLSTQLITQLRSLTTPLISRRSP